MTIILFSNSSLPLTWSTATLQCEVSFPEQRRESARPTGKVPSVRLGLSASPCARQAPLSLGLSRKEYWSGLPCPPPGDLPDAGLKLVSLMFLHWQMGSLPLVLPAKPESAIGIHISTASQLHFKRKQKQGDDKYGALKTPGPASWATLS